MKKALYVFLAVLTVCAMTMVSCGGGGGSTTYTVTFDSDGGSAVPATTGVESGDTIAKPADPTLDGKDFLGWYKADGTVWLFAEDVVTANITLKAVWADKQKDTEVRFIYANGSHAEVDFEAGETEWTDLLAGLDKKADTWPDATKEFGYWADQTGAKWPKTGADADNSIQSKLTFTAVFYSTVIKDDGTALEKLSLENAGLAIYKFDLGDNKLGDYKEFQVSYKVSEADINLSQSRHRVYGEFGTFVTQADTTGATLFDDTGVDGYQSDDNETTFINAPKFNVGDYIIINGGRDIAFTNEDGAIVKNLVSGEIKGDTWFTLKYELPATANAKSDFEATGALYFGLGQTTNADGRNGNTFEVQNRVHAPIVQLVKDIKLIHKSDASKDIGATVPPADNAQFMAYGAPGNIVWCWRGPAGSPAGVTPPEVEPPPPPDFPPATANYEKNITSVVLYYNDEGRDGDTRKRVTIANNVVTFNLQADDYNQSPGKFGGGGFKILFDGLSLPAISGVSDYRSYKTIILDTTITGSDIAGKQVIFSSPDGADVKTVVNNAAGATQYVTMVANANVFKIPVEDLVMADGKDVGLAVRTNNWASTNVPIQGTITVNKITFSKD